jgi:hypothetical protein
MLNVSFYDVSYQLRLVNGVLQIKVRDGAFVDSPLTRVSVARYHDGVIYAFLTDGTYRRMRITDLTAVATDTAVPSIVAEYQNAGTVGSNIPGTAGPAIVPPNPLNTIKPANYFESIEYQTQNHPEGGRSFSIWATNGTSVAVPVSFSAGLTLIAITGTATVYQTSSSLAEIQTSRAVWEAWTMGTTTAGGTLHGAVNGASAVYVEAIGGSAVLGIRD